MALMVEIVVVAPYHLGTPEDMPLERPAAKTPTEEKAELVIDGAHYLEWGVQGDAKEWELWAKQAIRLKNEKVYRIEGVKVQFLKDNVVAYDVTGDHGEILEETKNLVVKGNVVTRTANGYRYETDLMNYNSEMKTLDSPSAIRMTGPPDEDGSVLNLTGRVLHADLNTNIIEVGAHVRAHKVVQNGKTVVITSQRAILSGATHVAKFLGNVVMDVESVRVTGPEAEFKYRAGSDSTLESVVVRGGTRMSDVDKWATSQEVSYDVEKDRYIFSGSPRVVQNNDELVGDKIILEDGGKQIEVFNAKAKVDKKRMEHPAQ
jgi:LPS export ABC transporter protein LptC